jgi:hypothetical protein
MKKSPENREKLSNTYVKAKTMMFFGFATEIMHFWEIAYGIHRFYVLIFFFVNALRQ